MQERAPKIDRQLSLMLDSLAHFAVQPARPGKETQQFPSRVPDKTKHSFGRQRFGRLAGVSLHPPTQVLASPWCESIAARCIPQEANWSEHFVPFCTKYRRLQCGSLLLQLAEQTVRRRIELRNHIFECRLLGLSQGELRRDGRNIGLHEVGLGRGQLSLIAGHRI